MATFKWNSKAKVDLQTEESEILKWFLEYDNQTAQYARSMRQGKKFNKDITALDTEADIKAVRLKELRKILSQL